MDEWVRKSLEGHETPFDENAWASMEKFLEDLPPSMSSHPVDAHIQESLQDLEPSFDAGAWSAMEGMLDKFPASVSSHPIDETVRHSLKGYEAPFDAGAWSAMEKMLDRQPTATPLLFLNKWGGRVAAMLLLTLLSLGIYHFSSNQKNTTYKSPNTTKSSAVESAKSVVPSSEVESLNSVKEDGKVTPSVNVNKDAEIIQNVSSGKDLEKGKTSKIQPLKGTKEDSNSSSFKSSERVIPNNTKPSSSQSIQKNQKSSKTQETESLNNLMVNAPTYQNTVEKSGVSSAAIKNDPKLSNSSRVWEAGTEVANQNVSNTSDEDIQATLESGKVEGLAPAENFKESTPFTIISTPSKKDVDLLPTKENLLMSEPLALDVNLAEKVIPANLLPTAGAFYRHSIGWESGVNFNFVDNISDAQLGYSAGLSYQYHLNERWGIKTGLLFNQQSFYSEDIKSPPYILGTANKVNISYSSVEVPLLARYRFNPSKRLEAFVQAGHSVFVPVKETYYFSVTPPTRTELDVFENNYVPITNTSYATNNAARNDTDTAWDEASNLSSNPEAADASVLPIDEKTRPMWGFLNIGTGLKLKLNKRHSLALEANGKMSVDKQKYDLKVSDYTISNYKRYFSLGAALGWNYRFGFHKTVTKTKKPKRFFFDLNVRVRG